MNGSGPTSQTFISQRLRLNYLDWAKGEEIGDKPPLVLIHGGRDHARSWDWTARALSKEYRVFAMDHRGHGDSDWVSDGVYNVTDMVYDVAQFVHQLGCGPVRMIAHSMGGNVALRYTGMFPETITKLVAIEGLGPSPEWRDKMRETPYPQRQRDWIEKKRKAAGRAPRKYESIEAAYARMIEENSYLTEDQARHLTIHGVNRNEDGTYSWKFDPHLNVWPVEDIADEFLEDTWGAISCPTLLMYGADSWASNPEKDGRIRYFNTAEVVEFEKAGHWLHHDQFDRFISVVRDFLE